MRVLLLSSMLLVGVGLAAADKLDLDTKIAKSVALLYRQDESGSLKMLCTTTAFEKTKTGYLFVSAAHCIGDDNKSKERSADTGDKSFYITMDDPTNKTFYSAKSIGVGYQHRGDDFSIFSVDTADKLEFIPIGDEKNEKIGGAVTNVSSPYGLGRQLFHGSISSLRLDRPVILDDMNWRDSILLQIGGPGPGSSGSAVVSREQEKIVAFLVGVIGSQNIVAIPVSRFTAFRQAVEAGKYRWYKGNLNDSDEDDDKPAKK